MKKMFKKYAVIAITALTLSSNVYAESFGMDFNFFGVDPRKVAKERNLVPIVIGAVSSLIVHEAGHYIAGEMSGMDISFNTDRMAVWASAENPTNDEKAFYYAGGFIAQIVVGGVLTAIPQTRHSDFNVGFNSFTTVNSAFYTITGGIAGDDVSDIKNLDSVGYNGNAIGISSSLTGGIFSYIAIDKVK